MSPTGDLLATIIFLWECAPSACSGALARCTGIAHRQAQRPHWCNTRSTACARPLFQFYQSAVSAWDVGEPITDSRRLLAASALIAAPSTRSGSLDFLVLLEIYTLKTTICFNLRYKFRIRLDVRGERVPHAHEDSPQTRLLCAR